MKSVPITPVKPPPREDDPSRVPNVLIVDDEPDIREILNHALGARAVRVHHAATQAEAICILDQHRIDVALLDVTLPDGDGLELARRLHGHDPAFQSIVITGRPDLKNAVEAIRAGSCDFLSKPLNLSELNRCVDRALRRRDDHHRRSSRIRRLRGLCRKLNQARHETTTQVDILCNDLVTAYQELADQMKHLQTTMQFKAAIEQELDLEELLRRVLEFVLHYIGPTNAVVFLPAQSGGYTTGGYINYSFDKSTAEVLLQHLADVAAPRICDGDEPIHLTDNTEINLWLCDDSAWLADHHIVALPCCTKDDTLAALMLFRDAAEPYNPHVVEVLAAIAPLFAQHLVKVIDIHHRHLPEGADDDFDDDDFDEVPF